MANEILSTFEQVTENPKCMGYLSANAQRCFVFSPALINQPIDSMCSCLSIKQDSERDMWVVKNLETLTLYLN